MRIAFRRIGVYARLTVMGLVAVMIAVIFIKNRKHDTDVWFFRQFEQVNVVWVMLVSAGVSVVSYWILGQVRGVVRDVRRFRVEDREKKQRQDQERFAKGLAEREQRIDEKVKSALSEKAKDP